MRLADNLQKELDKPALAIVQAPALLLAGCSSAEPVSSWNWQ